MGTNYYIKVPASNRCEHCKREDPEQEIHVGKSSAGWKFGFNRKFKTAKEWFQFIRENEVMLYNEYGCPVLAEELIADINKAQDGLWLYDERYTGRDRYKLNDNQEFLDPEGYRIINAEDFC